ncbi:hypothetical protein [Neomegalonema sp.]|uniref:hypothetical protein n=1 Tax=Neomegalonema sp. TaxID=2039713 RepID=UPI00262C619B|nr:hypothetical protein [Neomegalonema sp.]MDD2869262.1 hypothetical protein [Neomegalonema sp.]
MNAMTSGAAYGLSGSGGGLAPWAAARWADAGAQGASASHAGHGGGAASRSWSSSASNANLSPWAAARWAQAPSGAQGASGSHAGHGAGAASGAWSSAAANANLSPWAAARWAQAPSGAQGVGAGAQYVNPYATREAMSGLPYIGWAFGGTTNANRDAAVDAAIAGGNVRSYQGSRGGQQPSGNIVGALLGGTIGAAGDVIGKGIAEVPILGNNDLLVGSTFSPILNVAFGQRVMNNEQIKRNAIYNFGPRADAYAARGDAFGQGVASGLRGEQVFAPPEQRLGIDVISNGLNRGLKFVSDLNIPVVSYFADAARSLTRGAAGESSYDWLNGGSADPMDPTWTVFSAPVNLAVSGMARRLAPVLGLDQAAMDARYGRALGDAMNVYDVFLPGDHTRHAFGSHLPRLIFGSPHNSNDHSHHHQFQTSDVGSGSGHFGHNYLDTWGRPSSGQYGAS